MLCNVNSRLTAQQVLDHEWIKVIRKDIQNFGTILNLNYNSLIEFSKMNKFKKSVLSFLALRTNTKELHDLTNIFTAVDTNCDGLITYEELENSLKKLNVKDADIKNLFNEIDHNKNGFINYTEFIAALLDEKIYLTEEKTYEAFKMFDKDNSGKISVNEINKVLNSNGLEEEESIKDLVKEFDKNSDGEIDYEEFCNMIGKKMTKRKRSSLDKFLESKAHLMKEK